jgi:hypothetical protein
MGLGIAKGRKQKRGEHEYFNKLDKFTRNLKFSETHGILIGPHSSNLISEIVLTSVDFKLGVKVVFLRMLLQSTFGDNFNCIIYDRSITRLV